MAYCVQADIENTYGKDNVRRWADLDNNNNATFIAARITWAINKADNHINMRLRKARYAIPFTVVPTEIRDLSAQYAGYFLYMSRGIDGDQDVKNELAPMYKEAEMTIQKILSGQYNLDADINDYTEVPIVITDE